MSPVLLGGRKPTRVKIRRGKKLGGRYEGKIFEVEVTVKRGGRKRTVTLAEKRFRRPSEDYGASVGIRNPRYQFKIMNELKELNRKEKLGLHILPTIRLRKRFLRNPTIISTRYNETWLGEKKLEEAKAQREREEELLKRHGYGVATNETWKLIKDPVTGEPTYYLVDFGHIIKEAEKRK